jgi:hypothetical protein
MATRPLAFGVRFRHQGRTVKVVADARDPRRYVVERSRGRAAAAERREHASLLDALRDFASLWRGRLH